MRTAPRLSPPETTLQAMQRWRYGIDRMLEWGETPSVRLLSEGQMRGLKDARRLIDRRVAEQSGAA